MLLPYVICALLIVWLALLTELYRLREIVDVRSHYAEREEQDPGLAEFLITAGVSLIFLVVLVLIWLLLHLDEFQRILIESVFAMFGLVLAYVFYAEKRNPHNSAAIRP